MMLLIPIMLVYGIFSVSGLFMIWGKKRTVEKVDLPDGVSVVIAVRNEEGSLQKLLTQILQQKVQSKLEVVVVNDHSTDRTWEILQEFAQKDERIIAINNSGEGKKEAIELAVNTASNSVLIQTDGDCEVQEFWIMSMLNRLINNDNRMVIGPVYPTQTSSAINGLIRLEWLAMQFITAFMARLKQPAIANGANMAFYKKDYLAYIQSKIGNQFASGDDVFFLKYLKDLGRAVYNLDSHSIVVTQMPDTFSGLLKQRIRWASKASKSSNFLSYLFSFIVATANFGWIAGIYAVIEDYRNLPILFITIGWKFVSDVVICWNMARFFKDPKVLKWLPVMFFVYPVYIFFGIFLSFKKKYNWKGRALK